MKRKPIRVLVVDDSALVRKLRAADGRTVVQDEASCVVFGMPRAAWAIGSAEAIVSLDEIPSWLLSACSGPVPRISAQVSPSAFA